MVCPQLLQALDCELCHSQLLSKILRHSVCEDVINIMSLPIRRGPNLFLSVSFGNFLSFTVIFLDMAGLLL